MRNRTIKLRTLCALIVAGQSYTNVHAQESIVTVMTSYPQELISRYEEAFETANPAIDMRIEWRRSDDAWQLLQSSPQTGVDVYWAPSIDTFAAMADAGYFTVLDLPRAGLPGRIGELLVDDPAGRFAAFEVTMNTRRFCMTAAQEECWKRSCGMVVKRHRRAPGCRHCRNRTGMRWWFS